MCDKENTTLQCSKCKVATYCSAICQKKHWKYQHKQECRPCLTDEHLLGHIFGGRSKNEILEYANVHGSDRYHEYGYPFLQAIALALQVSSKQLMAGLLEAAGEVSETTWARHWTPFERSALLMKNHTSIECEKYVNRLSPPFTAVVDLDGERPLPLRLFSTVDEFDRLKLIYAYSDHEGVEALTYFSQHYHNEEDASLLTLTKTCLNNDISFGTATESMHDALDRQEYASIQVAVTPGYDELTAAATAAQLIVPLNVKSRTGNDMYEVCNIETWSTLEQ
mmetsp:Transcript_2627/g.4789  ORF Transcript_2627/g.4789 Transcript_2627/m.4789 type:complete len:280 (+) Transcript_2627:2-841(+)